MEAESMLQEFSTAENEDSNVFFDFVVDQLYSFLYLRL